MIGMGRKLVVAGLGLRIVLEVVVRVPFFAIICMVE